MLDHVSWLRQAQLLSRASCQARSGASRWLVGCAARPKLKPPPATQMDGWCLWLPRPSGRRTTHSERNSTAGRTDLHCTRAACPLACFVCARQQALAAAFARAAPVADSLHASGASNSWQRCGWPRMTSVVSGLGSKLLDQSLELPQRFRVLFSLRGVGTPEATDALLAGACPCLAHLRAARLLLTPRTPRAAIDDPSALCRHEVAFALGQMQARRRVAALRCAN